MPDIGLLQGSRPRVVASPVVPKDGEVSTPVVSPSHDVAAPFIAPVSGAIAIVRAPIEEETVVSTAAATPEVSAFEAQTSGGPVSEATAPDAGPGPGGADLPRAPGAPPQVLAGGPPSIRLSDLFWLALALILIIGTGIGIRDPWPADEPRFASLARDMATTHEWLFPRVGGDLYQDKPPFFFWLLAIGYTIFGSVKASFLLPSFFAAGGVMFLIYDFGRRSVGREAGLAAALITVCTMQFLMVMRGAQIDGTLCFVTTFSLYALLRHLLLGPSWGWYFVGGFAAGIGIFTKGVGFLPVLLLVPYFALRATHWQGLATIDAGKGGWRWWLAPLAMLLGVSLWFVPMLIAVATSGNADYIAYRDEILFKQTVGRYAAAWHHVKPWYFFIVEVIPALWLPWSLLLIWLAPRFKAAFHERNARVWLPLFWVLIVLVFFSASPGKRGVYLLPALPAFALAALPFVGDVLSRAGVKRAGFVLAGLFFIAGAALAIGYSLDAKFAVDAVEAANLRSATAFYVFLVLCGAGLGFAYARAPLAAWPVAIGSLAIVFSYFIAPGMNGERSGSDFTKAMLTQVKPGEELALVAYKEQFLLYLDRPTVNFGHRRWQEGPLESYDAAAWLNAGSNRVLLVPKETIQKYSCFAANMTLAGRSSDDDWYLVRAPAVQTCAEKGDANRAITYDNHTH